MKENNEFYQMFKILNYLDIILGLALGVLVFFINTKYLLPSILGFFIAIISFYINAFTVNYVLKKEKNSGLVILSFILRIIIIGLIGLVLYTYNKFYIIAYVVGYTCRFISLFLYGFILKRS
ncbi:ATP synthase I chain [Clostridium homopropionicum DSM 5847]|uniref:ATP synthase I chain n=1 Tax=Clostridium homopropionicum DSM 5847 TaxID=1121318 RepID=A0A0L6Z5W4_9CLOT|nr:ATP synthase subunit I [Clostridium homopropionicum]KOA18360.1 ATP synthase I chain [Clostridium homopropionicum DSM 5847]SFF68462.1 ATP synthase protein I [Clostridium homopropionicum]